MSGPCLSSSVAGRPLRPATRHCLGEPLPHQLADRPRAHQEASCDFGFGVMSPLATCGINSPFGELSHTSRQIAHVLRTRSPLNYKCITTLITPFDLHVLSTPPAFVLSQNQTLRWKACLLCYTRENFWLSNSWRSVRLFFSLVVKLKKQNRRRNAQFSKCWLSFHIKNYLRSEFYRLR